MRRGGSGSGHDHPIIDARFAQAALEHLMDPVVVLSPLRDDTGTIVDFRYEYANPAACAANGAPAEAVIGAHLLDFVPRAVEIGLFADYCRVVETGEPLEREDVFYADPQPGPANRPLTEAFDVRAVAVGGGLVATWREVTARRQRENDLAALAAIVASSADAVVTITFDRVVTSWSAGAERLFGYTADEMVGESFARLVPPDRMEEYAGLPARVQAGEVITHFETQRVAKDGRRLDVSVALFPIHDATGATHEMAAVVRDVSATKAAERALEVAHEELERRATALERANEDLARFASVAAHDLRSPTAAISGLTDVLLGESLGPLAAPQREIVDRIAASTRRLLALIDDLLAYARVGATALREEPIDLAELAREALDALDEVVVRTVATVEVGPLPTVVGSRTLLRLLLQNLLGNALKFVAPGVVPHVRVDAEPVVTGWRVCVTDNGIGIPAPQRADVFEMFSRLHDASEYEGTGMGLAICKRIVEAHGGEIAIDDGPGGGTRVSFTVPGPR